MNKKILKITAAILVAVIVILSGVTIWGNNSVDTELITVETDKLSSKWNGYKIAHISDYHNTPNKNINKDLLDSLKNNKPDVIFITGDIIDCHRTDVSRSLEFINKIKEIAPIYYVTGNHECNFSINDQKAFDDMIADMVDSGVNVLRNSSGKIYKGEEFITIHGINDPYFHCEYSYEVESTTNDLCTELKVEDGFNILLAHHPEQPLVYARYGFDLVYSGHAHGGQVRLFGIGAIAPDQGLFPEYTNGLYKFDDTTLIVSRGIGNSLFPVRVFDRPHLIFTQIKTTHFTD